MHDAMTLGEYLAQAPACPAELRGTIGAIAWVTAELSRRIRGGGGPGGVLGAKLGANADGDRQTALDVAADVALATALAKTGVRWFASEERDGIEELDPKGRLAVAVDPLDGSSNIDVNVSIGTIFSVYRAEEGAEASFLRRGREQIAAGYVIYGPQTAMVLTMGRGTQMFLLDPDGGGFVRTGPDLKVPVTASEFAINASNYRHWTAPVRSFIDDCLSGEEGPRGRNFNMRWIASLVAEAHRILMRGGVFLYPEDGRKGYGRGRLRHVYECAPIAMLIEQAGGRATDGRTPILDQVPEALHGRIPFVFGSAELVDRVGAYHDLPERDVAPLFGQRGLFRA